MAKRDHRSARLASILFLLTITSCAQTEESSPESETTHASSEVVSDSLEYPAVTYSWNDAILESEALCYRVAPPAGYERQDVTSGSFDEWLRFLPLKEDGAPVLLHSGEEKWNQSVHHTVIDMDVGSRDLQQCADAVMRMRAEYLYQAGNYDQIHFNFTSGDRIDFSKWIQSSKPKVQGNSVSWVSCSSCSESYESFRKYMNLIFTYAGTSSLSKELGTVDVHELRAGDTFIQPGFPGHAVLVLDKANNEEGEVVFLLAQSYMPAQEMHVLINPNDHQLSPWYPLSEIGRVLETPEWDFSPPVLKRFE
jgi:hypothetical protein